MEESRDRDAAHLEADSCILATTHELEAAQLDAFKIKTGACSGTQVDEASSVRETTHSSTPRVRQSERSMTICHSENSSITLFCQ